VSLQVRGFAPISGTGGSRRAAEEAAASAFLVREGVWAAASAQKSGGSRPSSEGSAA
ncbi:ribonuclease III, partial [Mesorhizobium sp. M7A.F.Ca.US.005.03.2.1]